MTTNKTNRPGPTIISGELISDLAPAFAQLETKPGPDGMVLVNAHLDRSDAEPFVRALMRVEAELLVQDADALGTDDCQQRTPEQRRADALLELAARCINAREHTP